MDMSAAYVYTRYLASGAVFLILGITLFPIPLLDLLRSGEVGIVWTTTFLCPFIGLIAEANLRDHPARDDVKRVYSYVKSTLDSVIEKNGDVYNQFIDDLVHDEGPLNLVDFKVLLVKSIYETFVWSFPATSAYMARVNQQARLAYFYLNISRALALFIWIGGFSLLVKFLALKVSQLGLSDNSINSYLVPWIDFSNFQANSFFIFFPLLSLSLFGIYRIALYYRKIAKDLLLVELDSRISILARYHDDLLLITTKLISDKNALTSFKQKSIERGSEIIRKQSWSFIRGEKPKLNG